MLILYACQIDCRIVGVITVLRDLSMDSLCDLKYMICLRPPGSVSSPTGTEVLCKTSGQQEVDPSVEG